MHNLDVRILRTKMCINKNVKNVLCLLSKQWFDAVAPVSAGSPSRGGDVTVYVPDINQPSLPTPFYSVLVSVSVFMALSTVFHAINSPRQLSAFSLRSSGLIFALLVLSTIYLFMTVSLSPGIILCT